MSYLLDDASKILPPGIAPGSSPSESDVLSVGLWEQGWKKRPSSYAKAEASRPAYEETGGIYQGQGLHLLRRVPQTRAYLLRPPWLNPKSRTCTSVSSSTAMRSNYLS